MAMKKIAVGAARLIRKLCCLIQTWRAYEVAVFDCELRRVLYTNVCCKNLLETS